MKSDRILFEIQVDQDKTVILVGNKEIVQEGDRLTIQSRGTTQRDNAALCAQSAALSAGPGFTTA